MVQASCFNTPEVVFFIPETNCIFLKDRYVVFREGEKALYLNVSEVVRRNLNLQRNNYFKKPCLVFVEGNTRYIDGWRFTKGKMIAKGGHKVCKAVDNVSFVTLKQLIDDEIFKKRILDFKREFLIHNQLKKHPNVSKIFQTYVMFSRKKQMKVKLITLSYRYLGDGFNCRTRLGSLEIFYIIQDITAALKYLHDQKIIYGDVKLENILLSESKAVLCDMGNAGYQGKDKHFESHTDWYASPEMLYGKAVDLTTSTDVFSWSLAIELLGGFNLVTPFIKMINAGQNSYHEYSLYIEDYRERMMPSPYVAVTRAMMHPNPSSRPSIEVLDEHLKKFTNTLP